MKKVLEGRGVACTHEELGGGLQPTHSSITAAFSPSPTPALASGQGFSRQTSAARAGASQIKLPFPHFSGIVGHPPMMNNRGLTDV